MSQSREDYIKFIYEKGKDLPVSNKEIAQGLNVSPPSVSEMVSKLAKEGLLIHTPYQGGRLTPEGKAMALDIIRKHEIWEHFLVKKLAYPQDQVHDLAEILEHATPTHLAERLARFIDFDSSTKGVDDYESGENLTK